MRHRRAHLRTIRLRGRLRQLGGRLECGEEGLVLRERRQGLPDSEWRLRVSGRSIVQSTLVMQLRRWRRRAIFRRRLLYPLGHS